MRLVGGGREGLYRDLSVGWWVGVGWRRQWDCGEYKEQRSLMNERQKWSLRWTKSNKGFSSHHSVDKGKETKDLKTNFFLAPSQVGAA
jgi:hypothetical protein